MKDFNRKFRFAQFDIDEDLGMLDFIDPDNYGKAIRTLEHDPWQGSQPTLEKFLQAFFNDAWRIVSVVSVGHADMKNVRYIMVKQVTL